LLEIEAEFISCIYSGDFYLIVKRKKIDYPKPNLDWTHFFFLVFVRNLFIEWVIHGLFSDAF